MCLTEFVVESCVYYGCVPWSGAGFPLDASRLSQLADAPEIGLRDSARLLNCPDATDDTIGIYAVSDTDKMHKAMKALTLALVAAAAGRAQADLLVSALFGTEPPSYVHAAVANVLGFTLPTTKIVVVRKKVPWYKRHGHANATLARRHRGIRNHPRRHNPDGPGAPTPGDEADGVVVAAPAPQGISSELGALAALHRKGALTDSEFAAAKAKLLG